MKYIYIFLTFLAGLSTYQLSYTKFKAALILFVGIALVDFCVRFKTKRLKMIGVFFLEYSKYIWLLVVVSLLIFVVETSDKSLIVRGGTKIFYQALTIFIAMCAVYEFEEKAVLYTFYGFTLFNFVAMFLALKDTGSLNAAYRIVTLLIRSSKSTNKRYVFQDTRKGVFNYFIHVFTFGFD